MIWSSSWLSSMWGKISRGAGSMDGRDTAYIQGNFTLRNWASHEVSTQAPSYTFDFWIWTLRGSTASFKDCVPVSIHCIEKESGEKDLLTSRLLALPTVSHCCTRLHVSQTDASYCFDPQQTTTHKIFYLDFGIDLPDIQIYRPNAIRFCPHCWAEEQTSVACDFLQNRLRGCSCLSTKGGQSTIDERS